MREGRVVLELPLQRLHGGFDFPKGCTYQELSKSFQEKQISHFDKEVNSSFEENVNIYKT